MAAESPAGVSAESAEILVWNAHLVDPVAETVQLGSLLYREGRIAARGAADGAHLAQEHPRAARVDLEGAYLLPGLVDLRVHGGSQRSPGHVQDLGAEGTSQLLTAAGITLFADLHLGDLGRAWQRRQVETNSRSARIELGSPIITVAGGSGADLPTARIADTTAEADLLLDEFAPMSGPRRSAALTLIYDGRPPHRRMSREVLAHFLAAMRHRGLMIVVEVGTWRDANEALSEGARFLCHLPEGEMPDEVRRLVRALRPSWIPTLSVGRDFVQLLGSAELRADAQLRRLAPSELIADYAKVRIPQTRFAEARERQRMSDRTLSDLDALGVRWLAGSDAGSVGTFFGWSLRRELESWAQAGIGPWKILRGATVDAARMLGQNYGVQVGCVADHVVLTADPSSDLGSLASPVAIISRGRWVDADAMLAMVGGEIREELPPNPIPFGGRFGLLITVVLGFAILLTIRAGIKRAVRGGDAS